MWFRVEHNMAFPSTLDFKMKANAVKTEIRQQVHYPISGSTVKPLDLVTFSLSTARYGEYLDPLASYLSFTFSNLDSSSNVTLDGSGYAVIDRATLLSSGATISDLQNYSAWSQVILDTQTGTTKGGTASTFMGTGYDSNNSLNLIRTGATIPASGSLNISLPLIGTAIDGSSDSHLIPVGSMSDLQLQLYISAVNNAVYTTNAAGANWQLSSVSLTCFYVQIDAGAQKMIDDATGGSIRWSCQLWKTYNYNLNSGSSADNVVVPIKCASATMVLAIYRKAANINNAAAYTTLSRICPFVSGASFFATIGSQTVPPVPIKNAPMAMAEYLKAWHGLYEPMALITCFDQNTWTVAKPAAETDPTKVGSFVAGLNLEAYSQKSGVLHSGLPILGGTSLVLNQVYAGMVDSSSNPVTGLPANVLQTTMVHYDAVCEVKDGLFTVAF